jgi:hypothetical protein
MNCSLDPATTQRERIANALGWMGARTFSGVRHFGLLGPHINEILLSFALTGESYNLGRNLPPGSPAVPPRYWPQLQTLSLPALDDTGAFLVRRLVTARIAPGVGSLPTIRLPASLTLNPLVNWI